MLRNVTGDVDNASECTITLDSLALQRVVLKRQDANSRQGLDNKRAKR